MKNLKLIVLAAIAGLALQSCTIAKFGGKGSVPLILNQTNENMEIMEHVTVSKTIKFDYTGSYDVADALAQTIAEKKPDAVSNIDVKVKITVGNYFLTMVTCGFANAKTIVVDADFLQYVDESGEEGEKTNGKKKKKRGKR